MTNILKNICFTFIILGINCLTFAQEVAKTDTDSKIKFNVKEQISYFNLSNDDIMEYDTSISFKLIDKLNVELSIPVYNDNNTPQSGQEVTWQLNNGVYGKSGVGLGNLDVNASYDAFKINDIDVKVLGGIGIPLGTEFDSNSPVFHGGFLFGYGKDKWNLSQSVEYFVVDEYAYEPFFGGFVDTNYFELNTKFSYGISDVFNLCGNVSQFYADDQQMVLVGPSLEYGIADNVNLNVGILFSAVDELNYDSLDSVVTAGISFKF